MANQITFTHGEAENAAGLAADMASDTRFSDWLEQRSDDLGGWSGFIYLTLRVGPIVERLMLPDDWEVLSYYEMLGVVTDALFAYTGDVEDHAQLEAAIAPQLHAELARLKALYELR